MADYKTDDAWLMQGDCLERMKEIPSSSVDLVLTDPPYNIARENNFSTMGRAGQGLTLVSGTKEPIFSLTLQKFGES